MNGYLYIVATPIGNLQDISLRAINTLRSVDVIACEDTRRTGILLNELEKMKKYDNGSERPQLISYYEQNELVRLPEIINALKNGKNVALVSDAGTPTISDPGFKLVRECIRAGIKVESIPGPSSLISALVVSGLPTDKFLFVGYLPKKPGHREKLLKNIKEGNNYVESTVIVFESPHRLINTLQIMQGIYGNIEIVVARELTKIHEEVKRGLIPSIIDYYSSNKPRGEIVILLSFKS
ncbi:MAG: 16S rRNA (cytidine(1402)-2'-O)-methyltransferase [Candidatus Levybacteria bacterium]|nr:16S rRNA (cytidine(1402)-2'-O)-methyltransferase [Candidatus Levybacteria bacterium]